MNPIQSRSHAPSVSLTSTAPRRTGELSGEGIVVLANKRVIFVTDDRDVKNETAVMPFVFASAGASKDSKVIPYSEFFSTDREVEKADIFILRSSRLFALKPTDLSHSLGRLRNSNPNSAVIVCISDGNDLIHLRPLNDSGIINSFDQRSSDDRVLMHDAVAYCR